jgi:cell division transport system permease protein
MLLISNVQSRVQRLRHEVRLEVFLRDDVSPAGLLALEQELAAQDGVAAVEYVDKPEALRRYRDWAAGSAQLIEELAENPLPASLVVTLEPGPEVERRGGAIVERLAGRAEVEETRFDRDWLRRVDALLDLARIGGAGMAGLVFAAVAFVMASVLRLAVYARRQEIEIMLLVGATPAFVRGPFIVAGLGQGLVAGLAALAAIEAARRGALAYAGSGSLAVLDLVASSPLPGTRSLLLVLVGLVVSATGAYFAVRRSL